MRSRTLTKLFLNVILTITISTLVVFLLLIDMTIKLSKETKQRLIQSIKRYFEEEIGEEIGDLKASLFLDFCLQEICPSVYNKCDR